MIHEEQLTADASKIQHEEGSRYVPYASESENESPFRSSSKIEERRRFIPSSSASQDESSTSCGMYGQLDRPNWMSRLGSRFLNSKVGEVFWPGTHDSGAYCQDFDYGKVVQYDTLRWVGTHLLNCLGPTVNRVASEWSRTQTMNVKEQLEHGVRYLDLRISHCTKDGAYYIVHSFCGPSLVEVLDQIAIFLSLHKEECLLVEVDPVSRVDHVQLHNIFEKGLGDLLLRREEGNYSVSPMSLTLLNLITKGRVVVLYKLSSSYECRGSLPCFWDNQCIYAPFVMSLDPSVKEGYQLEHFQHFSSEHHKSEGKKHQKLFHFMYALTPKLSEILKSAFKPMFSQGASENPVNLLECAQKINPRLAYFLDRIKDIVLSEEYSDMGMIFSVDFVGDSDLMDHIIKLNELRFN